MGLLLERVDEMMDTKRVELTPQGDERMNDLLMLLDGDGRVTDTYSERDVIDLALTMLALAAKCDPSQSTQRTLTRAVALFRIENGKV